MIPGGKPASWVSRARYGDVRGAISLDLESKKSISRGVPPGEEARGVLDNYGVASGNGRSNLVQRTSNLASTPQRPPQFV
jgi:hypothetical protein